MDERGRIKGASGKRPLLKNVSREQVTAFLRQVELIPLIGEQRDAVVLGASHSAAASGPGPFDGAPADVRIETVRATEPEILVTDPAGFFVVYPDAMRKQLTVEHYTTDGVLDCVFEGTTPGAVVAATIERHLLVRLDHAAYLGRELARAENCLRTGESYVQDRAPAPSGQPESTLPARIPYPEAACRRFTAVLGPASNRTSFPWSGNRR